MLIHNEDDIKFVTELPCFLGHPVLQNASHPSFFNVKVIGKHSNFQNRCHVLENTTFVITSGLSGARKTFIFCQLYSIYMAVGKLIDQMLCSSDVF